MFEWQEVGCEGAGPMSRQPAAEGCIETRRDLCRSAAVEVLPLGAGWGRVYQSVSGALS
jgi:hypothetical protein